MPGCRRPRLRQPSSWWRRGEQRRRGSRRSARRAPLQTSGDPDRLPLGAAQAGLPEAHLPRPGPGDHPAADLRDGPEPAPASRPRRQHLCLTDHAIGPGDARADAALPVGLHASADRLARGRRHRRGRGRQRHAQDDPHPLGRPWPGVRREGTGGGYLRDDRGFPFRCRGDRGRRGRLGLQSRHHLFGHRRLAVGRVAAGVRRQRLLPDSPDRSREHRRAAVDRDPQQRRGGGGRGGGHDPAVHHRSDSGS